MMTSYLYLLYKMFRGGILAIPGRAIGFFFFIFILLIPVIINQPYVIRILTLAAIFSIFAASWDLLSGYAGQLNLGHALFFGVGAYSAALLNIHLSLPPYLTIPVGALIAILVGLVVGLPALRLRGFYLALVTLGFPTILLGVVHSFPELSGGEMGLFGIDPLSTSNILNYYIIVLVMEGSVLLMWKLTDATNKMIRTGIIFRAIREDEITARTSGINTTRYKLLAFALSGFFAGIAGGLSTHFLTSTGCSTLELSLSFQVVLWTIFGGITTIYGAVAGVYILYSLVEFICIYEVGASIRFIVFALILIFTLLYMPEGITTWVLDKIEIICPRCKVKNIATRRSCRACNALLRL